MGACFGVYLVREAFPEIISIGNNRETAEQTVVTILEYVVKIAFVVYILAPKVVVTNGRTGNRIASVDCAIKTFISCRKVSVFNQVTRCCRRRLILIICVDKCGVKTECRSDGLMRCYFIVMPFKSILSIRGGVESDCLIVRNVKSLGIDALNSIGSHVGI